MVQTLPEPSVTRAAGPSLLERYEQAASLTPDRIAGLLRNRRVDPVWTGRGEEFWYARQTDDGVEHVLVDPETGSRRVAPSLADLGVAAPAAADRAGVLPGPDGRGLVRRGEDLWVVERDGTERPVTHDGETGFAWGALPANSNMVVPFRRMGLVLPPLGTVHSPSGRFVLTMRVDERGMRLRHMVEQVSPGGGARPECHEWPVLLEDEGDPAPAQWRILDLDGDGTVDGTVDLDRPEELTSGLMVNGSCEATWSADEQTLYLLQYRTGGSRLTICAVDVRTGRRTDALVVDEAPLYEPNQFLYSLPLVRVLPESAEALVFSQRDGWGHLYLYDLATGECRHRVTEGDLVVRDILALDTSRREVTFVAGGPTGNPLLRHVYRAGLDGGSQHLLTPELADHDVAAPEPQFFELVFGQGKQPTSSLSPSGRFLVDHQSTVTEPPVIVLRDTWDAGAPGRVVLELERTDVSRLVAAGYRAPEEFTVRVDGVDLWGVLALPEHPHDPLSIPVVEHVYAGFQISHVPTSYVGGGKVGGAHGYLPGLTALGFAAVMVDGRGTPGRHRDLRQWTFGQFHTSRGLADHVAALTALQEQHPALDLRRVGVTGHSYGGYNTARMMLLFPDFYVAGVSSAGVHDPRKMPRGAWDWHLGATHPRTGADYDGLGNLHLAERLAGDLLLMVGEIDENATLDHTFALVQALMQAGKRFDLKVWPGLNHYQLTPYVQMATWDHFVRSLLGLAPPAAFVPGRAG